MAPPGPKVPLKREFTYYHPTVSVGLPEKSLSKSKLIHFGIPASFF